MRSLELIYKAVDEINAQNPDAPPVSKSPDTLLLDAKGGVDSLTLVNLVVAIEQIVFDETGKSITLADESIFSSADNPFQSVGSLAAYLDNISAVA
jgi:acyl carrier protein